jgi:hypothetical protein
MKEEETILEIRSAIENVTRETLADALAIVLAEESMVSTTAMEIMTLEFANFAQAILYLKKKYEFMELDLFTTEADLVYVQTGGRRILLTDPQSQAIRSIPNIEHDDREIKSRTSSSENTQDKKQNSFDDEECGRFMHLEL